MAETVDGAAGLQQRLRAVEALFLARLPQRLQELQAALAQCERTAFRGSAELTALHVLLHKMAGSAGTFGCKELGARARECELAVDAIRSEDNRDAASLVAGLVHDFLEWARRTPALADPGRIIDRGTTCQPL